MAKATPQQLDERRTKRAWKQYQDARAKLNAHVEENADAFEAAYDLADTVNTARKRAEKVMRETGIGVGPVTVSITRTPVFDTDYLETLIAKRYPDMVDELFTKTTTVQRKVFERLVQDGMITAAQSKKAITEMKPGTRLTGLPDEIVLP